MTLLAAFVHSDRVLIAADGTAVTVPTDPEFPVMGERAIKYMPVPKTNLMVGTTGPVGNLRDYLDALSDHPLTTWREVISAAKAEIVEVNAATERLARRAGEATPQKSGALIAGFVAGHAVCTRVGNAR